MLPWKNGRTGIFVQTIKTSGKRPDKTMETVVAEKKVPLGAQKEPFLVAGFIEPFLDFFYGTEDHLGSTRMVLDQNGSIKQALMYQAYGTVSDVQGINTASTDPLRNKFTTKEFDEDGEGNGAPGIDAYHFGLRFYDPEIGIWNRPDPMDQYWNSYSYSGGNPINGIDPNGAEFDDIDEGQSSEDSYSSWLDDNSLFGSIFQDAETALFEEMSKSEEEYSWSDFQNAVSSMNANMSGGGTENGNWQEYSNSIDLPPSYSELIPEGVEPLGLPTGGLDLIIDFGGEVGKDASLAMLLIAITKGKVKSLKTPTVDELSDAAKKTDKNGHTRAGFELQKHGDRPGSAFPQIKGPAEKRNAIRQDIVDDILTDPGSITKTNRYGGVDVIAPDGRALRYDAQGNLHSFREPNKK